MGTRLTRFTQRVREIRGERYTALMGMLYDPEELRESFERQDGRKAPRVDGVKKADYTEGLEMMPRSRIVQNLYYRICG